MNPRPAIEFSNTHISLGSPWLHIQAPPQAGAPSFAPFARLEAKAQVMTSWQAAGFHFKMAFHFLWKAAKELF